MLPELMRDSTGNHACGRALKGTKWLLPRIVLTRTLSFLSCLWNCAFFMFWVMLEGIADETQKTL